MTDKEKIRQEIERRISQFEAKYPKDLGGYWNDEESAAYDCAEEYKQFLLFIDSLSEEPASENLEEEIENYIKDSLAIKFPTTDKEQIKSDIRYIARHFAKWGRNHFEDKSEMVSKDLNEEIESFWNSHDGSMNKLEYQRIIDCARHFAEWQKQKDHEIIELAEDHAMLSGMNRMKEEMMKDAVEAEVFVDYNINFGYGSLTANIDLDEQHLKEGDKVKIIIVKED